MSDRRLAKSTLNYGLITLGGAGFFGSIYLSLTAFGAMSRGGNARIHWMTSGILLVFSIGCWVAASVFEKRLHQPDELNSPHELQQVCPMCGHPLSQRECDNCGERVGEREAANE